MADMQDEKPTAVLRSEHQVILRVIDVLKRLVARSDRGEGFERKALGHCVKFFQLFADACHHAKEEDLLFPALESRGIPREGGPIGMMIYEHGIARGLTRDMAEALEACDRDESDAKGRLHEAARQYADLLTSHIFKEDNVLFNMGDQVLTDEDQSSLCGKFCEVGCRSFGGQTREELERLADDLEQKWPA